MPAATREAAIAAMQADIRVFEIGTQGRRRMVAFDELTQRYIVCSDEYDFNGDTIAVFGECVDGAGDTPECPAYGKLIEEPDRDLVDRTTAAIFRSYMPKVIRKHIKQRLVFPDQNILVIFSPFDGVQEVVVTRDVWLKTRVGSVRMAA